MVTGDIVCLQVKGYRYLEEDNSDESDSEKSEADDENHLAEEMEEEDREEEGRDAGAERAESPIARRRVAQGHRPGQQDDNVKE